jgi:hypothetical protein
VNETQESTAADGLVRRHLLAGWLGLLAFLSLGIALETLHGLKVDFYLDLKNEPRRMLWTLAHTHGTLFSLVSIAFAWSLTQLRYFPERRWVSAFLLFGGQVLLPSGFFLGGVWLYSGDPNLFILLVPAGAFLVLLGVAGVCLRLFIAAGKKPKDAADASVAETRTGQRRSRRIK